MGCFKSSLLDNRGFTITCELVPGRGYIGKDVERVFRFAKDASTSDEIRTVSLTDNAGGNPALSPDVLGPEILDMGLDLIIHISCKDMNRNALEARIMALHRFKITNLLIVTGDFPFTGYLGLPKPVFDMDSVTLCYYVKQMNKGIEVVLRNKSDKLSPTDFFIGSCVSPFKWDEGSSVMQYVKLEKKIAAGSDYLITQLGYDARKFHETIHYIRHHLGSRIPVLGSVYMLSAGAAKMMNSGEIPGCYVSDGLLNAVREERNSEDKGKKARLLRAAKQIAVLKGLGFTGAHIEGFNLQVEDVKYIIGKSVLMENDWPEFYKEFDYTPEKPFYYFSNLNVGAVNKEKKDQVAAVKRKRGVLLSPKFWAMRLVHKLFFIKKTPGYGLFRFISKVAERNRFLFVLLRAFEVSVKSMLFGCKRCDDCMLFELFYLCPESQCPKSMRNGPCGGSRVGGKCEVFPKRDCLWVKVYRRAVNRKQVHLLKKIVVPRNWQLFETSSWINYFLKKDHSGVDINGK
ncbi:MAG: methylenetetrahydrofolate reductase C-terminal domain-containing protein [Spirochaetales bacterium]|nr:methylenetetrahydrofolate reductase C-terminal domain-containing protein [Spirochaetales bacterium]